MNHNKTFQNAQDLSVSVGNTYSEYQLMHIFLDKFHQSELRREGDFADQKSLSISSLRTDHLNIYSTSGCGKNSKRENCVQTECNFCEGTNHSEEKCFKRIRKKKKNLVRLVIWTTDVRNARLANVLDANLKII